MALDATGSRREQFHALDDNVRDKLINTHVLVGDPRRWRPRWFDGRFLAASDLLAEQNYFLVRQADLGRAAGSGIIAGLDVTLIDRPDGQTDQLSIAPGHGVTDTGELVTVFETLTINPADVPEMRRLDAAFGLQVIANDGGRTRTGLYLLALRPVEWSAHPIGAYPTSLTGPRTVEDGTIVEGAAVSLIPYPDAGNEETWESRRARVAREIFVEGRDRGFDSGVLPLAMVALRGNVVIWIDPFLVRRETGAERPAGMDFGFGNRPLREAHLLQYESHLADALNRYKDAPFSATAAFAALPPVGRFPSSTIDPQRITQRFFPPGVDVEVSFVPEDELPALIEESLLLPPIDLMRSFEELTGTGVVVLAVLSRDDFAARSATLTDWNAQPVRLRPGFVTLKAFASPRELLLSRTRVPTGGVLPDTELEAWRTLLRDAMKSPLLWYVRRRHLPLASNAAATPVNATSERVEDRSALASMARTDSELHSRLEQLRAADLPEAAALTRRLAAAAVVNQPALVRSLVDVAIGGKTGPTAKTVLAALAHTADPKLGTGLSRLSDDASLGERFRTMAATDPKMLHDVDRLARDVPRKQLKEFATKLRGSLGRTSELPKNFGHKLSELRRTFAPPPR
jgi:hypothetical protein